MYLSIIKYFERGVVLPLSTKYFPDGVAAPMLTSPKNPEPKPGWRNMDNSVTQESVVEVVCWLRKGEDLENCVLDSTLYKEEFMANDSLSYDI